MKVSKIFINSILYYDILDLNLSHNDNMDTLTESSTIDLLNKLNVFDLANLYNYLSTNEYVFPRKGKFNIPYIII